MEKENKELTKSQKFWRSWLGKICSFLYNYFDDFLNSIIDPKPSVVYEAGGIAIVNKYFEEDNKVWEERERKRRDKRKKARLKREGREQRQGQGQGQRRGLELRQGQRRGLELRQGQRLVQGRRRELEQR